MKAKLRTMLLSCLALLLVLGMTSVACAYDVSFSDVPEDSWFYTDVMTLAESGVIGGYPDGTYRPTKKVTTGEALKMILLAAGYPEPEPAASHWARGYLNFAIEQGFLTRYEDISDLDVNMTRGLVAKLAANALGLSDPGTYGTFTDTDSPYVEALCAAGIVGGYPDGTYRPGASISRAEIAAIVNRIYQSREPSLPADNDTDLDIDPSQIKLRTTEQMIALLKSKEGFRATAYWDYSQYSIGYGSYCEKDEYPDGITEKQADRLLRKRLQGFEAKLDEFLDKNSIRLKEQEYDALVSFTYNNGDYWMREKNQSRLAALLISGRYSVNEFASAFGIWCHVTSSSGTEIHNGLIERRLKELKLFFYGDYDGRNTDGFSYVIFRTEKGSLDVDVAVYETGSYYDPMFEASCDDDEFFGWVTENGVVIDENTRVEENLTLTALWRSEAEGWF